MQWLVLLLHSSRDLGSFLTLAVVFGDLHILSVTMGFPWVLQILTCPKDVLYECDYVYET